MRARLFWIVVGGLSFWLPSIVDYAVLNQNASWLVSNVLSLAGLVLLGVATWLVAKQHPRWGWVLAGIYILGPALMMAPSAFIHGRASVSVPGGNIWLVLFCLFPPMTLWMAVLNGMIFSVLAATAILPFLAVYLRDHSLRPGPSVSQ